MQPRHTFSLVEEQQVIMMCINCWVSGATTGLHKKKREEIKCTMGAWQFECRHVVQVLAMSSLYLPALLLFLLFIVNTFIPGHLRS